MTAPATTDRREIARRALALLDLTSLNDDDTDEVIRALCRRATTPAGHVAAVCLYPAFIAIARDGLRGSGVKIATVVNFPDGGDDIDAAVAETENALAAGADEVDLVMPYRTWLAGNRQLAGDMIAACKGACGDKRLKVILETGALADPALIRAAADQAIAAGADFIKTSTGKIEVGSTLPAARAMLEAIRDSGRRDVGFKAAGGIRTLRDAALYLALAGEIMGDGWATPETFRFGASGLLDDLLAHLGLTYEKTSESGY